jgi:hypothetical protein
VSVLIVAGGAALFAVGLGVGSAVTLALARDKLEAMTLAAERARSLILAQSDGALKDLAEAHSKAEAMLGAIETAKRSTARADASVTSLIEKIEDSRANLKEVAERRWFPGSTLTAPPAREPLMQHAPPSLEDPLDAASK